VAASAAASSSSSSSSSSSDAGSSLESAWGLQGPFTKPLPERDASGVLVFADAPRFRPNLTPAEILQAGSFGGTYFRPIFSTVTGNVSGNADVAHISLNTEAFGRLFVPFLAPKSWTFVFRACDAQDVRGHWKELPESWLKGLNIGKLVASPTYRPGVNRYGVKCGQDLKAWHDSGWIRAQDPAGWFHWYCRYYRGRRSEVRPIESLEHEANAGERG
jgi:hypothetical protein